MNSGQLLLISDLEGCAEKSPPTNGNIPQTTVLCQDSTFKAIHQFLDRNPENKVAFLGDYFDKGPFVVNSINGIAGLLSDFPHDRVHIIVGNRDVNKLRLIYELTLGKQTDLSETDFWKPELINGIINQPDTLEKLNLILGTTMGAKGTGLQINTLSKENLETFKTRNISKDQYLAYVLLKAFNVKVAELFLNGKGIDDGDLQGEDKDFIKNCRVLFENAKIVHYDDKYKVLLSHAGGFTKTGAFILDNIQYYKNILTKLAETTTTANNYYSQIFVAQQELQKEPTNDYTKVDLNEVVDFHNNLFTKSLNFDADKNAIPSEYFLLQAMGLNGSPNYYSFIASCGLNGSCQMDFNVNDALIEKLSQTGIQFVASGHQPHCTTVPLIYKQNTVVFIANDTSNGYRPEDLINKLQLQNIPLSFIGEDASCGVCSLDPTGSLIKASDEKGKQISALSQDGKTQNYYENLVKDYSDVSRVPTIEDIKKILKSDSKPFQPLQVITQNDVTSNTIKGGKRRSKKYNKQSKLKKRSGKNTRKLKRKQRMKVNRKY